MTFQEQLQAALGTAYVLERELGGGGMSRVYLATECALKRPVVIKVLPPELEGAVSLERFRREMLVVAKLQHPLIVPLLTAGEAGGLLYYTMPFVEGTSLRAELERDGKLPIARVSRILSDVLEALAYAHAHGVVHRDIKPENVLLATNRAVVSDFGVAKALSLAGSTAGGGVTTAGIAIGSPTYMSPEQAAGDPNTDHRADLYATGVMAYEMLAGEAPFRAATPSRVIAAHMMETPAPIASKRRDVPPAMAALVMRLLEKDPAARPESAEAALKALSDGAPTGSRPSALGKRAALATLAAGVVVAAAFVLWTVRRKPGAEGRAPSIAVLPFRDLSPAHDNAYFSEGMAEELIHVLGKAGGLRVAGRASSFAFRGTDPDARDVGKKLDVSAVLEGSLQRSGDTLRVIARLVDAAADSTIWSQQYDRPVRDVFALQDELTASIVRELRVHLAAGGPAAGAAGTADLEAYDLFLQGRYAWNQRTPESIKRAIEFFSRSIACDSNYARAYAGLADAYNVQGALFYVPFGAGEAKAKAAALKALALDPDLAEAHTALGFVHVLYEWDGDAARREFERAIALDPNYPSARLFYGYYLQGWVSVDSAVGQIRRAFELDPLSLTINLRYADALQAARQYPASIAQYRRTIALEPTFPLHPGGLAMSFALAGQFDSARREFARLDQPGRRFVAGERAFAYARAGFRDSAVATIAELRRRAPSNPQVDWDLTVAYTGLNERDSAFAALYRAVDARIPTATLAATDPELDFLASDPRFSALFRRIQGRH